MSAPTARGGALRTRSLGAKLVETSPREKGGAVASSRLNFQHAWAVFCIARLHEQGLPYVVLVEFHDDVAVLNHETEPTSVDFYQIKASREDLKVSDLAKSDAGDAHEAGGPGKPRSILGKLLDHWTRFGPEVGRLTIVSRPGFGKQKLTDGSSISDHDSVGIEALSSEALEAIKKAISIELGSDFAAPWSIVHLERCDFSLGRCDVHCTGELHKVLRKVSPDIEIEPESFYRTLKAKLLRQFANEHRASSLKEIATTCGYRRSDFDSAVSNVRLIAHRSRFKEAKDDLRAEGVAFSEIEALEEGWFLYGLHLMNPSSKIHEELRDQLVVTIAALSHLESSSGLAEFVDQGEQDYRRHFGPPVAPVTFLEVRGGLLFERARERDRKLSQAASQPSTEEY